MDNDLQRLVRFGLGDWEREELRLVENDKGVFRYKYPNDPIEDMERLPRYAV